MGVQVCVDGSLRITAYDPAIPGAVPTTAATDTQTAPQTTTTSTGLDYTFHPGPYCGSFTDSEGSSGRFLRVNGISCYEAETVVNNWKVNNGKPGQGWSCFLHADGPGQLVICGETGSPDDFSFLVQ